MPTCIHPEKMYEGVNMSSKMMNVSIQVLPLVDDAIPIVERAIKVIQKSGVKYEVSTLSSGRSS